MLVHAFEKLRLLFDIAPYENGIEIKRLEVWDTETDHVYEYSASYVNRFELIEEGKYTFDLKSKEHDTMSLEIRVRRVAIHSTLDFELRLTHDLHAYFAKRQYDYGSDIKYTEDPLLRWDTKASEDRIFKEMKIICKLEELPPAQRTAFLSAYVDRLNKSRT